MSGPGTHANGQRLTLVSRLTGSLGDGKWGFFLAELVLLVAGILIALAIDGWVGDARDRQTEAVYLELLSRDIDEIRRQAMDQIEFEKRQIEKGIEAYEILNSSNPGGDQAKLGSLLGALSARRTLNLSSATFDEIVSSGNLELIHNRELRHQLVRFFAQMELRERIAEKNNQDLIDDIYVPFLMRTGITVQLGSLSSVEIVNRATEILEERMNSVVVHPEDRVLSAPPESDSWNDIKRNLLFRLRIAAVGQVGAEYILDATDEISSALAAELDRG